MSDQPMRTGDEPTADELRLVEERLQRERPVPRPAFRSELRSGLFARPSRDWRRARALITAYASSGLILLLAAIVGIAGVGPLAA